LGQQQRSAGLDASGLASLLGSQKDQIIAAIPSGLADQLSAAGLIDRAVGTVRSDTAAASAAGSRIAGASERAVSGAGRAAYARTGAASSQWPYWLAALVVLGGLAWYGLGRQAGETVAELPRPATTQPATGTVGMAPSDLTIGGVNLANQVNTSVGTLRSILPTITDAASAQAALPKLREATAQLNEVSNLATKLTPQGKSALATLIAAAMPTLNQMCDKVLATPGAGDIAKPTIDELRGKFDTLSRA
jgi:MYXO-CTERM domain-containing protein